MKFCFVFMFASVIAVAVTFTIPAESQPESEIPTIIDSEPQHQPARQISTSLLDFSNEIGIEDDDESDLTLAAVDGGADTNEDEIFGTSSINSPLPSPTREPPRLVVHRRRYPEERIQANPNEMGHSNPLLYIDHVYDSVIARAVLNVQLREHILQDAIVFRNVYARLKKDGEDIAATNARIDQLIIKMKETFIKTNTKMDKEFAKVRVDINQVDDKVERLKIVVKENKESIDQDMRAAEKETKRVDHKASVSETRLKKTVETIMAIATNPAAAMKPATELIQSFSQ